MTKANGGNVWLKAFDFYHLKKFSAKNEIQKLTHDVKNMFNCLQ